MDKYKLIRESDGNNVWLRGKNNCGNSRKANLDKKIAGYSGDIVNFTVHAVL